MIHIRFKTLIQLIELEVRLTTSNKYRNCQHRREETTIKSMIPLGLKNLSIITDNKQGRGNFYNGQFYNINIVSEFRAQVLVTQKAPCTLESSDNLFWTWSLRLSLKDYGPLGPSCTWELGSSHYTRRRLPLSLHQTSRHTQYHRDPGSSQNMLVFSVDAEWYQDHRPRNHSARLGTWNWSVQRGYRFDCRKALVQPDEEGFCWRRSDWVEARVGKRW